MKKVFFIILSLISTIAHAQDYPDNGLNKMRIIDSDRTIEAEIYPVNGNPCAKSNLFYYWYAANLIHVTQGGYSGNLLNGHYEEFYPNKSLKEQGIFKKGLKNGVWKSWNKDGTLHLIRNWKNGTDVTGQQPFIAQKLKFLTRRQSQLADTALKHR